MVPTVSVIIPAYNREDTIHRAINSVLVQTYEDFEIIVVDDGSSDQTCEIVQHIGDARIRMIRHPRNQGAAQARNTGMQAATGKYIAWLDSDDEWLREKMQVQLDAFVQAAPDQKACYTAFERIDQRFGRVNYVSKFTDLKRLFLACDVAATTLLFERSVLDKIGYLDTSFIRYEDWDWLLRYCSKYRLLPVEQPLARIYYTSERSSKDVEISAYKFVSKYADKLQRYGGWYGKVVISRRWLEVASYYAQDHSAARTAYFVFKGLAVYPFQPLEIWAWVVNAWFGIKIGLLPSKIKALFIGSRK